MQKDSALEPILRRLELWRPFDDKDKAAILSLPHRVCSFAHSAHVVRDGDEPRSSGMLLSGHAFRHKIVANGARQIYAIHIPGEFVDLQNAFLERADHSVQALTPTEILVIPNQAILKIAFERPRVGKALWYATLVDAAIFREWISNVGRRDARSRIGHLLCEFSSRLEAAGLGSRTTFEFPLTQEQIGDCTALTSVHVNRTLKALEQEGLIRRSGRTIAIPDWATMVKVADFDAGYLHLNARNRQPA